MPKEDEIRRFLGHVHCLVHGNADVRGVQGRRVIDAVAHVAHDVAGLLQRQDDALLLVGIHLREDGGVLRDVPECLVLQICHLLCGQNGFGRQADDLRDVPGHQAVVAGDDLDVHAKFLKLIKGLARVLPGRVEKQQEAREGHAALILPNGIDGLPRDELDGDAQDAVALGAPGGKAFPDRPALRRIQRLVFVPQAYLCTDVQHVIQRALGDEHRPDRASGVRVDDHAEALAVEVVGDLVKLVHARGVQVRTGQDRLVQRVGDPGLERRVEIGPAHDLVRGLPQGIQRAVQPHDAQGERAGLVRAKNVHAAQVLNGVQAPNDHPVFCHALGAPGQADADDGGQQFRRDAHGKGDGEQERVDHRLVKEGVDDKNRRHQQSHDLGEQIAELPDAALKLCLRRAQGQAARDLAERGAGPGPGDQDAGRPAADAGAHEDHVDPGGQGGIGAHLPRRLVDRESFAGQHCLADEEIPGLQHDAVGRDQAARAEQDDVPRHGFLRLDGHRFPVPENGRFQRDLRAELLHRLPRGVFLGKAQQGAGQDDRQHDKRIDPFADDGGNDRGEDEDQHERIGELGQEHPQPGTMPPGTERVSPVARKAFTRGGRAQPVRRAARFLKEGVRRKAPIRGRIEVRGCHHVFHQITHLPLIQNSQDPVITAGCATGLTGMQSVRHAGSVVRRLTIRRSSRFINALLRRREECVSRRDPIT